MNRQIFCITFCIFVTLSCALLLATPREDKKNKGATVRGKSGTDQIVLEQIPQQRVRGQKVPGGEEQYTVLLRSDGTATYFGLAGVERIGRYKGTFSKDDYSRLAKTLKSKTFFKVLDMHSTFMAPGGGPMCQIIGLIQGDVRKAAGSGDTARVKDPADFQASVVAIRRVTEGINWQKDEPAATTSGIRGTIQYLPRRPYQSSIWVTLHLAGGINSITGQSFKNEPNPTEHFQFNLPPGEYVLTSGMSWLYRAAPPVAMPQLVVVQPEKYTDVVIQLSHHRRKVEAP